MLMIEHLALSVIAGVISGGLLYALGVDSLFILVFVFGILLAQAGDLDHYAGSLGDLLKGGMALRMEDIPKDLKRGGFHDPQVLEILGAGLLGAALGWAIHLRADLLI